MARMAAKFKVQGFLSDVAAEAFEQYRQAHGFSESKATARLIEKALVSLGFRLDVDAHPRPVSFVQDVRAGLEAQGIVSPNPRVLDSMAQVHVGAVGHGANGFAHPAPETTLIKPRNDREARFTELYNAKKSNAEIAEAMGMTVGRARTLASELRNAGVLRPREELV